MRRADSERPSARKDDWNSIKSGSYRPENGFSMTASAVATFMGAVTGEPPSCPISSTLSCVLRMLICISSVQLNRVGEHADPADRSEERRVGQERVSTCRNRWSSSHEKQKSNTDKNEQHPIK